jgi:ribonuclease Y
VSWIYFAGLLAFGVLGGYLSYGLLDYYRRQQAEQKAEEILAEARALSEETPDEIKQKKKELDRYRESLKEDIERLEDQVESLQERLESLSERIDNRSDIAEKIQGEVEDLRSRVQEKRDKLEELVEERNETLQEKAERSRDDLLDSLEDEILSENKLVARDLKSNRVNSMEGRKRKTSKRILGRTLNRCDVTTPVEVPSAVLKFPDDDAYDQFQEFYEEHQEELIEAIDSDVRFEEDQSMAVVETLKPIKKEIAHRTLNNIIQQKKFNFELIPEGIERYTRQVQSECERAAREAIKDTGVQDVPEELLELLGVLKFRTSYGQQQLVHSLEVAHLGGLMAQEIGADADVTRRAGLLHDVGKAIDRQREQGHAVIGAELTEEAGEPDVVVNAVGSHHGDMEPEYVESILVAAADAISGSRPGVRRENVTNYSERIESLRELAGERKGIRKVYAMNAGRELRIRVDRHVINDSEMEDLAKEIAEDIESELTYSGQIKINTIRETKITENINTN